MFFSRIRAWFTSLGYRSFMAVGSMYVAAASLIGFEMLAVIIGYATIWPVGAPLLVIGIGVYAVIRRRLRRKSAELDADGPQREPQGIGE